MFNKFINYKAIYLDVLLAESSAMAVEREKVK